MWFGVYLDNRYLIALFSYESDAKAFLKMQQERFSKSYISFSYAALSKPIYMNPDGILNIMANAL